ncbi:olfactory receptor 1G1-like [Ambystoma mexicanum]|uniref:olfactory receptor 1G1-like n=1 Tax=Ambystoma mexicanum TaxID=8296 RepID=UPI0037E8F81C
MKGENQNSSGYFLILGFSDLPEMQVPLFGAFVMVYLVTWVGNLLIIATVYSNAQLQTPMYFFLTNLSFVDISLTTVIFPRMLAGFFQEGTWISFTQCLTQMHFFMAMMAVEFYILTVMAYDRYIAICHPLRYMTIMNHSVCMWLASASWVMGLIEPIGHTIAMSKISFCESHTINHFFCDIAVLMKLSCSSTLTIELLTYIMGTLITMMSFVLIITSYVNIISSILKIQSDTGRRKAFSTCASHLTVVFLVYGSIFAAYFRPASTLSDNRISSLAYIAIAPVCNPVIYSLKNTELKKALRKNKNSS